MLTDSPRGSNPDAAPTAHSPAHPTFDASWPPAARDLVARAIDRHGGWSLWQRLEAVTLIPRSLRGLLPWVKGYGRTWALPGAITTLPKHARTEFHDYPGKGQVGVFAAGDVQICDDRGQLIAQSRAHRHSFRGLRKLRRWSALDALYFFGYAFAGYAAVPFGLPALRFCRLVQARRHGRALTGVTVEFPAGVDVHSRRQSYFFDETGLLRRNDYVADVVGPLARAAHFSDDVVTVAGLPIPRRRIVVPRIGLVFPFVPVLDAAFDTPVVRLAG